MNGRAVCELRIVVVHGLEDEGDGHDIKDQQIEIQAQHRLPDSYIAGPGYVIDIEVPVAQEQGLTPQR